jgi:hypothetical protein
MKKEQYRLQRIGYDAMRYSDALYSASWKKGTKEE